MTRDAGFFDPEIHRISGELLVLAGDDDGASACFGEALARARELGHCASECRATESLAKLLMRSGRTDEAREILGRFVARSQEGRSTPMFARVIAMWGENV